MDITNEKIFELLVKLAGRIDVFEEKLTELENEIKFIKRILIKNGNK